VITTADGVIQGTDAGTLSVAATGPSTLVGTINLTSGTGKYRNVSGALSISGVADFVLGTMGGVYEGAVCRPHDYGRLKDTI
jgi:hypothetical protein